MNRLYSVGDPGVIQLARGMPKLQNLNVAGLIQLTELSLYELAVGCEQLRVSQEPTFCFLFHTYTTFPNMHQGPRRVRVRTRYPKRPLKYDQRKTICVFGNEVLRLSASIGMITTAYRVSCMVLLFNYLLFGLV